jgi:hypothetical protein
MRKVPVRHVLFAALSSCLLGGCGAPDLEAMKPSVVKPSAVVVLVDQPQGWSANTTGSLASQQHVVAKVINCSSQELAQVLNKLLTQYTAGLYLIVSPGSPQPDALTIAKEHLGQRFEWVSSDAVTGLGVNIRQVVPDRNATSYALGWLAATLAAAKSPIPLVGWLGGPVQDTAAVKAALTGMYGANAAVTLVPVSPPGSTDLNAAPSSALPPVVVTDRALTVRESTWLSSSGVTVISLLPQSGRHTAADPGFPGPDAVADDLHRLAVHKWQGGVKTVLPDPLVDIQDPAISDSLRASMQAIGTSFASQKADVERMWQQIPDTLRQKWAGVTGVVG